MKWLSAACVFAAIVAGHFLYATRSVSTSSGEGSWAAYRFEQPEESRLARYTGPGEYWLGFSYGLAGAFAAVCLGRAVKARRGALAASTGGIALGGLLWAAGCFFIGCCGSPMLPIYLGLLGPKFLGVTRPLTFGVTLLSVTIGYVWMTKRAVKRNSKKCQPSST